MLRHAKKNQLARLHVVLPLYVFTSLRLLCLLCLQCAATFSMQSVQSDMTLQLFKKSISDAPRQTRRVCLRGFRCFTNCHSMGMISAAMLPVQCSSKPHMVRCNAPGLLQIAALVLQAESTTVEKCIVRKSFQQTCDIGILIAVPSKVLWPLKSAGNLCW